MKTCTLYVLVQVNSYREFCHCDLQNGLIPRNTKLQKCDQYNGIGLQALRYRSIPNIVLTLRTSVMRIAG